MTKDEAQHSRWTFYEALKIELLVAKDCPIRKSCVRIEEEINSICDHAGPFPLTERAQVDFGRITCLQGDHTRVLDVTELCVEGCLLGKNCAECENRLLVFIPSAPQPEKSHGYVKCACRGVGGVRFDVCWVRW